jgi:hypothetical protein
MNDNSDVQIPSKAVGDKTDVSAPITALLRNLYLLGTDREQADAKGLDAAVAGPPQSVALIEAGATTATKYWAGGLSAAVAAGWATIGAWWGTQETGVQASVVGGAALATGAIALAIGYLFGSDVRGRAAAAVATIEARSRVAVEMIQAAREAHEKTTPGSDVQRVPLPSPLKAKKLKGPDQKGWLVVAMERQTDGKWKYVAVKGSAEEVLEAGELEFE